MKLCDYAKCVEISQLMVAMGVSSISALPNIDEEDAEIRRQLTKSAIPVKKSDITQGAGSLLEYKGRKVVVYIRDQKAAVNFAQNRSDYRYHLCNCSTLQSMRDIGREHRFLATQRNDGLFEVHDLTVNPIQKGVVRMELCKNCIDILWLKNKYSYPFVLKDYFEQNDSYTPASIRKEEDVPELPIYTPDQEELSKKYRKACSYKCQLCSVDCSKLHGLLHLHHVDGNPSNNQRYNLKVLCVDCHSKQPMHGHMLRNPKFKKEINMITKLRNEQGILTISI